MFLHSGASLHGHEYSNRPPSHYPQQGPRRSPLLRSALASANSSSSTPSYTSSSSAATTTTAASSVSPSPASVPASSPAPAPPAFRSSALTNGSTRSRALRSRPHQRNISEGYFNPAPRLPEPVVRFQDPVVASPTTPRTPTPSQPRPPPPPRQPPPPSSSSQFRPRAPTPMSEDESSFSATEGYSSDQTGSMRRVHRRRVPRKSTAYLFAHPAPKLRTRKQLLRHIRPTLLMQLQQLSQDRRPIPAIDVYPSSLIAGNVVPPRFPKLPRLFGVNGELGIHDTILLRSEDYDSPYSGFESDLEDEVLKKPREPRELLAVLSPLRREARAEIVLEDGTVWMATPLPTGSFDFVRVDAFGRTTTGRWVRRALNRRASVGLCDIPSDLPGSTEPDCKFTFSILDPDSRRHPILATLTKDTLDILDRYTTVSSSSGRYPPTREWTKTPVPGDGEASNDEDDLEDQDGGRHIPPRTTAFLNDAGRTTLPVDGTLKDLICITAIWVLMQNGWAQLPINGGALCSSLSAANSPVSGSFGVGGGVLRSVSGSFRRQRSSMTIDGSQLEQRASESGTERRGRRLLSLRKSPTTSMTMESPGLDRDDSPSCVTRVPLRSTIPQKASSTGAAFVQRRKHLAQMSDTSDSERPSSISRVRRRARTFSRLSGEFTPKAIAKLRQSPAPFEMGIGGTPGSTESSHATLSSASSVRHTPTSAVDVPTRAATVTPTTAVMPRGRRSISDKRTVSAYYSYAVDPVLRSDLAGVTDLTNNMNNSTVSIVNNNNNTNNNYNNMNNTNNSGYLSEASRGLDAVRRQSQQPTPSIVDRDGNAKWKRLSGWIRKLGGH